MIVVQPAILMLQYYPMKELFENEIAFAAEILQRGEVVAFPTETVYGLGACLFDEKAIQKLFVLKGRPSDNPLIAHIAKLEDLSRIARNIPKEAYQLADKFWPGPLSIILEANPEVPSIARAGLPSIAVRMPAHPLALALIEKAGQPLVAPSANLSGKPSATKAEHVLHDFGDKVTILDGGPCDKGLESTVLDLRNPKVPRVLRPGHISRERLSEALGCPVDLGDEAICPGTKYRHYAPKAAIRLFHDKGLLEEQISSKCIVLSKDGGTLSEAKFYDTLRQADLFSIEEILILCDDSILANEGFYNRILKAAGKP